MLHTRVLLLIFFLSICSIGTYASASLKARPALVKPQHLDVNVTAVVETILNFLSHSVHGVKHAGTVAGDIGSYAGGKLVKGANFTARQTAKYSVIAGKGLMTGAKATASRADEGGKMLMKYSVQAGKFTFNSINETVGELCDKCAKRGSRVASSISREGALIAQEVWKMVSIGGDAGANLSQIIVNVSCDFLKELSEGSVDACASIGNACKTGTLVITNNLEKGIRYCMKELKCGVCYTWGKVKGSRILSIQNLARVENSIGDVKSFVVENQALLNTMAGSFLLVYGNQYKNTLIFFHSFRHVWPAVLASFKKLSISYKATRQAFEEEVPTLIKKKNQLLSLESKLVQLNNDIRALTDAQRESKSKIDIKTYKAKLSTLENEVRTVSESIGQIKAIDNSVGHLITAIDPKRIEEMMKVIYAGCLVGIAGLKENKIAKVSMGTTIGTSLNNLISPYINTTINKSGSYSKWVKQGMSAVTVSSGIALVRFYESLGPSIACSTIAAQIIPVADVLHAIAGKRKILGSIVPSFKTTETEIKQSDINVAQTILVYMGIVLQMKRRDLPQALKICLAPLKVVESLLKRVAQ